MIVVTTFEELAAAVRRDEAVIHLEGAAKDYYEKRVSNAVGGVLVGAVPGFLFGGPVGAIAGAAIGAAVTGTLSERPAFEREIAGFLLRFYRRTSSGVTYIELTHR